MTRDDTREILFRITAPRFCAGVIMDQRTGLVVQAAPVLRWTKGRLLSDIRDYCSRKRWKMEMVR